MSPLASHGPAARARVFAALDALGIAHETREHPPIRSVADGDALALDMAGGRTKNLFLVDKAGSFFLAVTLGDRRADLRALAAAVGADGRLSFGSEAALLEVLGAPPGFVSAFALLNDRAGRVAAIAVDAATLETAPLWSHPLDNAASTALAPGDLLAFVRSLGREPVIAPFSAPPG